MNLLLSLIAVLVLLAITQQAKAEQARIFSCSTFDGGDKSPEDWIREFRELKKDSGILMNADETVESFSSFDPDKQSPEELKAQYGDREFADIKNAHSLSAEPKQCGNKRCTVCGTFEGDVVYKNKVSALPIPTVQLPVPAEALSRERFILPILSAGILEGSAWREDEVRNRLERIKQLYATCGVEIENIELKSIPNPNGQYDHVIDETDTRDSSNIVTNFEREVGKMIESVGLKRPAILYLKDFHSALYAGADRCMGGDHAYDEKNVPRQSPIIGLALIADNAEPSIANSPACADSTKSLGGYADFVLESHELGHLLLSEPGHSSEPNNVMIGIPNRPDLKFNAQQCAEMRGSPYLQRQSK